MLRLWQTILWLLVLAGIAVSIYQYSKENLYYAAQSALVTILCLYIIFAPLGNRVWKTKEKIAKEWELVKKNKAIAWNQMRPLNRLFDWDITVRMISKTVPRIQFDPFFTVGRLHELYDVFGMNDEYNADKSVLFAHSGEINGNPFVLGRTLYMEWGEEIYEGTREVTYDEDDDDGDSHEKTETLSATVIKPKPEYFTETFLIYGCEAAPKLIFHRLCSGLANKEHSFWGKLSKSSECKKLKRYSRILDDESQYTMMANSDFETLFNTMDRNNEVEFRLLFTPIAQTQMLEVLRNKTDGYGDDFDFNKLQKLNVIQARHLNDIDLDNNPNRYKNYSVDAMRSEFMIYNQNYFKALYFAFAPLLTIPLYQQTRSHENIYGSKKNRHSCFWEHEALANFYGDKYFEHPECATRCILKTEAKHRRTQSTLSVTAHGYKAIPRVEKVLVTAGNGQDYAVDVHWKEYVAISKTSNMFIEEDEMGFEKCEMNAEERAEYIDKKESSIRGSIYRRSILSLKKKKS